MESCGNIRKGKHRDEKSDQINAAGYCRIEKNKSLRADYMTMCCVAGSFNSIPENREKERK